MLSIVSSLAEEVNSIKFGLNQVAFAGGSLPFQKNLEETIVRKSLIEVSDDDEDDENDDDNETDEDDESDDDEVDVEDDESDEDSDDNQTIQIGGADITILKIGQKEDDDITELNVDDLQNKKDDEDDDDNDNDNLEDLEDLVSVSSESSVNEPLEINLEAEANQLSEPTELEESTMLELEESSLNDIKKINIMDLEEVKSIQASESNDYKKMSVQKLRSLVVERNLINESSKMKKPELLKLLGEE